MYQALSLLVAIPVVKLEDITLNVSFIKVSLLVSKTWFLGPILDRSNPEIYINSPATMIKSHSSITNKALRALV